VVTMQFVGVKIILMCGHKLSSKIKHWTRTSWSKASH